MKHSLYDTTANASHLEKTVEYIPGPMYGVFDEVRVVLEGAQGYGPVLGVHTAPVRLGLEW